LDLGLRPLELELRHALDRWPREERTVGDEVERTARLRLGDGGGLGGRLHALAFRPRRQRRTLADLTVGDPAEDLLRKLREHDRRVRRDLDAEAAGELRDPGELVGRGRDRRAAQALDAALEVHVAAVAL